MDSSEKNGAPYAPVVCVLAAIDEHRSSRLRSPLTLAALIALGVSSGNAPRTLAALRFLGFVGDRNELTHQAESLRTVPAPEYRAFLQRVIRRAYKPILDQLDPRISNKANVREAFRVYEPQSQWDRMATLFIGLCKESGIIPGPRPGRSKKARSATAVAVQLPDQADAPSYQQLSALIAQLPTNGKWNSARRDLWLNAFTSVLDLLVEEVGDANSASVNRDDERNEAQAS